MHNLEDCLRSELQIIGLRYFDGITNGALKCPYCQCAFAFDMVAQCDTEEEDIRVFTLRPLLPGDFEAIVESCPQTNPINWPIWVPYWQSQSPGLESEAESAKQIQNLLNQSEKIIGVFAWDNYTKKVISIRQIDSELSNNRDTDWFEFLGVKIGNL